MKAYTKEQMDAMAAEAFATDEFEENIDLGFDPTDVVAGDAEAVSEFVDFMQLQKKNKITKKHASA